MREVAILIDGGFFIKRLSQLRHLSDPPKVEEAMASFHKVCDNHLRHLSKRYGLNIPPRGNGNERWRSIQNRHGLLHRIFYYDAPPFEGRAAYPISKKQINFALTDRAVFQRALFEELRKSRDVALRLGQLGGTSRWIMHESRQKALLRGDLKVDDLTDGDFRYDLSQKGVDMRIGLDIAALTLKKHVKIIVLVTGDADFVPAAKLARREGVEIILDPLRHNISKDLFEHIDGLRHGLPKAGEQEAAAIEEIADIEDDN